MYKYLFGPVPSRRLGISLGIDLVPRKVCSLDCVYCEVGKTTKLTVERNEYVLFEKVRGELEDFFSKNPDPDYITFSGSGEPLLNTRVKDIISFIRTKKPKQKIAVLTNGTLFYDKAVRDAILEADVVLPSLDAATQGVFEKINRPESSLSAERCIEGLIQFRREYRGLIWLEVLVLPGYNDSDDELLRIKDAIQKIQPDLVQVNTLDRPGAIQNLRGATQAELQRVLDIWNLENAEIVKSAPQRKNLVSYRGDAESAILDTIARRPCTLHDLTEILGMHGNEVNKYLDVLEAEKKIQSEYQDRGIFYKKY